MGRLLLRVIAGVAVVVAFFWLLSVVVGLLVWLGALALFAGIVLLGVRVLKAHGGRER